MTSHIFEIWTYLAAQPLTGLSLTLIAFVLAERLHRALRGPRLLPPVVLAIGLVVVALRATETPYATYFEGAQFVHFLLGPATVALAVPLYARLGEVRRVLPPLGVALILGSGVAVVSAVGLAWALGESDGRVLASLAPKSVTTPVAMGIAERLGGAPSLTAVLVILTGIVGAVLGGPTLDLVRVRDPRARGLAYGVAAHGIGTARAFEEGQRAGAFSSLGMGLNALVTALLLPLLKVLLARIGFGGG